MGVVVLHVVNCSQLILHKDAVEGKFRSQTRRRVLKNTVVTGQYFRSSWMQGSEW
jgi:hypothetical protein